MSALGDALRQAAGWCDEHPEVSDGMRGRISAAVFGDSARASLTELADALGADVTERTDGAFVYVERPFADGLVTVGKWASVNALGGVLAPKPVAKYEPILGARP